MMLSVVFLTYRAGGYDLLAHSLSRQTYEDYELICVDERTNRRDVVYDYLADHGIPVSYIGPSKPKCFPELPFNLINAYNTGVLMSRGDVIIILNDYTWLPPDSLKKNVLRAEELGDMTAFSNVACEIPYTKGDHVNHPISIWKNPWNESPTGEATWIPRVFELFYSAIPYRLLQETNGFPECYDYHKANQVEPFIQKVGAVGGELYVDKDNVCYHLQHRGWGGSTWHQGSRVGQGQLIERENCFDLKTHERGVIPWLS